MTEVQIREIDESELFSGKSKIQPLIDAAVARPGKWLEIVHPSANMVGRFRSYGLEARGQRNAEKTESTIQFRFPVGGTLLTPPKKVVTRKPKAAAKAKK